MINQRIYPKAWLANWLLRISLFCSVLTFSGFIDLSPPSAPNTTQTEVIFRGNDNPLKTVSYKRACYFVTNDIDLSLLLQRQTYALLIFNKKTQAAFKAASRQMYTIEKLHRFIPKKSIPQYSNSEDSTLLLG